MFSMQPENQSPHTFIVRLWRERSEDRAFIWRGSVDYVQSGERAYFQNAARLVEIIWLMLKGAPMENEPSNESSALDENPNENTNETLIPKK